MSVNFKPEGYNTITPYFISSSADKLIAFIKEAFEAKENGIHRLEDGSIMHADFTIGDSHVMISSATDKYPANNLMLHLYMEDVDSVYNQALKAGGKSLREPTNEFYGDRSAGIEDPLGNQWWIATHIEDISEEEMEKRMQNN